MSVTEINRFVYAWFRQGERYSVIFSTAVVAQEFAVTDCTLMRSSDGGETWEAA